MTSNRLLVANRGEVAIRIARAAAELGLHPVAVYSEDDAASLHIHKADEARALRGHGPAAYLDVPQLVSLAEHAGCGALHPGYGFASESPALARACRDADIRFVGPEPDTLELLGDKLRARELAARAEVPVLPATGHAASAQEARSFLESLGGEASIVIKAVAGGGGRGMRVVTDPEHLSEAYERCRSEARAAFGNDALYAEQLVPRARHIEVQVLGDGTGAVAQLGERECSLQRRHQKLVEMAPSPTLSPELRAAILEAAVRMARGVRYRGLGTFEFLVDDETARFYFIEANPRLQVEHTVTEEVFGVDLVQAQLQVCQGCTLAELGLEQPGIPAPRGLAVQLRVNTETLTADGDFTPTGGTLHAFDLPGGPGVRVDTCGYAGYTTNPRFDSLLAKLVVHTASGRLEDALRKAYRALCELRVEGVATNVPFLQALVCHETVRHNGVYTRFVEDQMASLLAASEAPHRQLYATGAASASTARADSGDPLAILQHGQSAPAAASPQSPAAVPQADAPDGSVAVPAPMMGTVVGVEVAAGDQVRAGQALVVLAAMKMEHVVQAPSSGIVRQLAVSPGDTVQAEQTLLFLEEGEAPGEAARDEQPVDLGAIRPDLAETLERHAHGHDARRPDAVARRRKHGYRTARENVEDLCDPESFVEYGALVIAAQRRRRGEQELIEQTPADGLIAGVARVNGERVGEARAQCIVMSYDYTVLAGTQGMQNHRKKDRMFELAEQWRLPVVVFAEGGGGRPGDSDGLGVSGLDTLAFHYYGKLSGLVPLVGIANGRCFAGNAALLGSSDVVIATESANIGMGGPAMIEGGGLGVYRPEDIGPIDVQRRNGVVDIVAKDEAEAVQAAKRYLSYFQGPLSEWTCADQRLLRSLVPENRLRVYDVRQVIETLGDSGETLELRRDFGHGMITALTRIEGRPLGVLANNPAHLAGAIDSDAADKAARFMQLCDAFDIPLLMLCDTPGIMVGPDAERTALVRHASRLFVTGGSLSVPFFTIVLRKGYGLGAQTMAGGSFKAPFFTVSWPTGEFGGMGLEGAVKLGFRKQLEAIEDPAERKRVFDNMVAAAYRHGKALNAASHFEIDDVIDPKDSRTWILSALGSLPPAPPRTTKKRPCIDTW